MWILIASILAALLLIGGGIVLYNYLRLRGARFVKCPENQKTEAVQVNEVSAALHACVGNPSLELRECTRWPEMKDCGQQCLQQIASAPEDCLVRNVVAQWYKDRKCVVCGSRFGVVHWHDHPPALLHQYGRTVQWTEVPLARLSEYLDTHDPVCWNCHIVESFRREHPELITYRKER